MPGAFQTHHHHIDVLSLYQEGMISKTIQSQMANSPVRTYTYFTILNPDNDLVHDNFCISIYMENNTFETPILLMQDILNPNNLKALTILPQMSIHLELCYFICLQNSLGTYILIQLHRIEKVIQYLPVSCMRVCIHVQRFVLLVDANACTPMLPQSRISNSFTAVILPFSFTNFTFQK